MRSFFANPWMLSAIIAIALPIIIEWLFRRRKRQVDLPTIIFLLRNKEQEKIRRQDRILLILRMLGIFLLVLALSRPLLKRGLIGGSEQRNLVILLDGTASMNQQMGVTTAFGLAQKKAAGLVRDLPENATVTVVYVGERVVPVMEGEKDRHTAAARIDSLRCGMGSGSISSGLAWIKEYTEKTNLNRAEIYVFSDFQKHTWLRPGGQTTEMSQLFNQLAARHETYLVDVGGEPAFNLLLTDLRPVEWTMTTGLPAQFRVTVDVWGQPPSDLKPTVTFLVDGVKKDIREIHLQGTESTTVTFDHNFASPGEHLIEAVLEGDKHLVDNRRFYLCTVPEHFQVLILDEGMPSTLMPVAGAASGGKGSGESAIRDLSRESAFLVRAIEPPSHPGMEKVSRFGAKVIHPSMLRYENLDRYHVVVVTQLSALEQGLAAKLENYVNDGGAVWFFLGPEVNQYEYNKLLYKDGGGLLPCALEGRVVESGTGSGEKTPPFLSFGESTHQALVELSQSVDKDARWLQYWSLRGVEQARTVLQLSNGQPAMVEKALGRGKVLLANSTAGINWSYLPATVEFPILVQEMLRYLVGNPDAMVNLQAGDVFRQPVYVTTQHLLLRLPDGDKVRLTPSKDATRTDAWTIEFSELNQQGPYEFVDVPQGVLVRTRFVVNQKSEEGNLSRLSRDEFQDAFGRAPWEWCGPEKPIEVIAAKRHAVTEFAPAILWALAVVLCVESFAAARFGRRRAIVTGTGSGKGAKVT
ncbi:MAG: BatA and WFA domain-containing protein [Kiritimatiellae bacterium]|nr:BatA and WFA domain-containing protein [Kiritimatiellia bacterium]